MRTRDRVLGRPLNSTICLGGRTHATWPRLGKSKQRPSLTTQETEDIDGVLQVEDPSVQILSSLPSKELLLRALETSRGHTGAGKRSRHENMSKKRTPREEN